jgi:hypothetical protein
MGLAKITKSVPWVFASVFGGASEKPDYCHKKGSRDWLDTRAPRCRDCGPRVCWLGSAARCFYWE